MATSSTTDLVDTLCQFRLLDSAQLEEMTLVPQDRFPDSQALAGELIRRGWLTPYQANQLLQGRGQELLLGSYVLLERLGEGGMGQVFKARNWKLGKIVSLKLIRKERLDNQDAVRRFEREVCAAAALSHPNIVHALDADHIGGTHLLVMEYVEGTDLARFVKKNGPLPVQQACQYIRQAALGLQHAFQRGMVHRDIKPANLLLTADGRTVKVLDMGLARLDRPADDDDKSSTMTQEGMVMGTPDYIAPEQALESHTVDIRADLYSLGCTFYHLLTGRVPFPGGTFIQKINKHQFEEPQPVEALRCEVSAGVAGVVRKLMAKKPEDRYQTPAELVAALATESSEDHGPPDDDDLTVVQGRRTEAGDTLGSAWADESPRADTIVLDSTQPQRWRTEGWRLLPHIVGACAVLLAGVVILWFLLKPPAGQMPQAIRRSSPSVGLAPPNKPQAEGAELWLKEVAALPAEKQVEAVATKLKEINPGFDGQVTHKIDKGVVTELELLTDDVTDLWPVQALGGLTRLNCSGTRDKGRLADLSPLKDMKLTSLVCAGTQVSDLSPLKGMKLKELNVWYTQVSDLSPLQGMELTILGCGGTQVSNLAPLTGMNLTELNIWGTPVSDLSPLKGMRLTTLACGGTKVSDLSPLKEMRLTNLACDHTPVSDLAPLRDMKLRILSCENTQVSDLSPLKDMPLKKLWCDFKAERDSEILRSIKTLEQINDKPAKKLLKKVDD